MMILVLARNWLYRWYKPFNIGGLFHWVYHIIHLEDLDIYFTLFYHPWTMHIYDMIPMISMTNIKLSIYQFTIIKLSITIINLLLSIYIIITTIINLSITIHWIDGEQFVTLCLQIYVIGILDIIYPLVI